MKKSIALQMYTVRDYAERDFLGTIKRIAAIGYQGIELAGTYGVDSHKLKEVLDSIGIKVCGTHIPIEFLENNFEELVEYNMHIGNKNIVCPWLPEDKRDSKSAWEETAKKLNLIGEKLRQSNFIFSYHNHSFEFENFGNKYGIEILLENTDLNNLKLEVDVFWVKYAGIDPVEFLVKHKERISLIHLKDMGADGKSFAEIGEGIIDFEPIFQIGDTSPSEWYIVEQDTSKGDTLTSARISFENLKRLYITR